MKKKIDFDTTVLIVLGSVIVLFFLGWTVISFVKGETQTRDFIEREIGGILVGLDNSGKGEYNLTIRQHKTRQEIKYYLFLSPFIEENNIQVNDSISKVANGHTINFYKKQNGTYEKCCNLYYY